MYVYIKFREQKFENAPCSFGDVTYEEVAIREWAF